MSRRGDPVRTRRTARWRVLALPVLCAPVLLAAGPVVASPVVASPVVASPVVASTVVASTVVAGAAVAPRLHVSGNRLVGANGRTVVLHGVNRSGGEFMCVQGHGIWDGPVNQASLTAMRKWHVNAVRVPLNEACWNGQSYVRRQYRGPAYRRAVAAYVRLLNRNGMVAILDLQWTDGAYTGRTAACTSARAVCQKPMPDAAQAIPFWRSVARAFKGNGSVVFDLFNEPFPQAALGEAAGWRCWSRGGSACPAASGFGYRVAGLQSLVHAVRSAGAPNVIIAGGLWWANDLTQWLRYRPSDPDHNLAASWHSYNFNACSSRACWNSQVGPVLAKVPVIAGEIGEKGCSDSYIGRLMKWLDARSASYLAWTWNADFSCSGGPSLITSYAGTPTRYGRGYRSHLLSLH
jgi:endoglucanase